MKENVEKRNVEQLKKTGKNTPLFRSEPKIKNVFPDLYRILPQM